jgi:hypothetical protein
LSPKQWMPVPGHEIAQLPVDSSLFSSFSPQNRDVQNNLQISRLSQPESQDIIPMIECNKIPWYKLLIYRTIYN